MPLRHFFFLFFFCSYLSLAQTDTLSAVRTDSIAFLLQQDRLILRNNPTGNGRIAHLFIEEDQNGHFRCASPTTVFDWNHNPAFRSNYWIHYLDLKNPFFRPRFQWFGYRICLIHFIALGCSVLLQLITFRRINKRMQESRFFKRWSYRLMKLLLWVAVVLGNVLVFSAVDFYYQQVHLRQHRIDEAKGFTTKKLIELLQNKTVFDTQSSQKLGVELYRKSGNTWTSQQEEAVLYFSIDSNQRARFLGSRSVLEIPSWKVHEKAQNHYIVCRREGPHGKTQYELWLFKGKQLRRQTLKTKDPSRHILVYVNGYRPVSSAQDPEKAFAQLSQKGLEYPASANFIFNEDRYAYWHRNPEFCQKLEAHFKPDLLLFADGHHSVSSSNHRSLLRFAGSAALYPKPCRSENHHCYYTTLSDSKTIRTYALLATQSNYEGFMERYRSGQIAGLNLLQVLNTYPEKSKNDSLDIVSHSMGHAYAMGMMQVLKHRINFRFYWAFAPENPVGRYLNTKHWREVRQFGTRLYGPHRQAPCLQDGVAPQQRIKGLASKQQRFFPNKERKHMGYFASHYIGYYTWVFD